MPVKIYGARPTELLYAIKINKATGIIRTKGDFLIRGLNSAVMYLVVRVKSLVNRLEEAHIKAGARGINSRVEIKFECIKLGVEGSKIEKRLTIIINKYFLGLY